MSASEIVALARAARVEGGRSVLDLCCGAGAVALHLVERTGCRVVGIDQESDAVTLAARTARARGLQSSTRFLVADVMRPPLRATFDAILLLETMISIKDKAGALATVHDRLPPGGRLALTLEEGWPLDPGERALLPGGERSWLIAEGAFLELVAEGGWQVMLREDYTTSHAEVARGLVDALRTPELADGSPRERSIREEALVSAACWAEWLSSRRVRKLAFVLERRDQ